MFSLYEDDFKSNLAANFKEQTLFKDITMDDLKMVNDTVNYEELCKLAVAYSDGVIQNSQNVNQKVLEFAKSINVPVLEYQSEDAYADAVNAFYDQV